MSKILQGVGFALICVGAIGCAVDNSQVWHLAPAHPNQNISREGQVASLPSQDLSKFENEKSEIHSDNEAVNENASGSRSSEEPKDNAPLASETLPIEQVPVLDEKSLVTPHDLVLDLSASQEEEEDSDQKAREARLPAPVEKVPNPFVYDIPVVRNAAVDRWIDYFTGPGRSRFAYWLRQSGRYVGSFRKILREKNLPEDLAYVPLIESGFTLLARSRAGAVGPWQFMPATARRSGLKVNRFIDERRHPVKATHAAAFYLSELFAEFQDWNLALAAYNSGENRVRRAIRRTGKDSYWALARTRYLPNETKNYVPKFLAGLIIAKHPEVFGFADIDYLEPLEFEVISLPRGMSLRHVANLAGVSLREIIELNSEIRRRYTPPVKGHQLRLPVGTADGFLEKLARAPREPYPTAGRYRIRSGDTFGSVARRFGVSLQSLLDLNAHINPRRLKIGSEILLPIPSRKGKTVIAKIQTQKRNRSVNHTVVRGENVWLISQRYGVPPEEILSLNGLTASTTIYPGRRLRIR